MFSSSQPVLHFDYRQQPPQAFLPVTVQKKVSGNKDQTDLRKEKSRNELAAEAGTQVHGVFDYRQSISPARYVGPMPPNPGEIHVSRSPVKALATIQPAGMMGDILASRYTPPVPPPKKFKGRDRWANRHLDVMRDLSPTKELPGLHVRKVSMPAPPFHHPLHEF